jgi:hypothetical protein
VVETAGIRTRNLNNARAQIIRDLDAARRAARGRAMGTLPGPSPSFDWMGLTGSMVGIAGNAAANGAFSRNRER